MAAEPEIVADGDEADNPFLWDLDRVAGDSGKSGEKMEENLERKLGIRVLQRRSDGYGVGIGEAEREDGFLHQTL